jgi:uncharacterized protein involved in type VI secretion and phage assembly
LAGRGQGWIEQRVETVRAQLHQFDGHGDLTPLTPEALLELAELLDRANKDCLAIVHEFERQMPSAS